MGWFDAINSAAKATVKVAATPLAVVADVCTGGGDLAEGGDCHTEKLLKSAKKSAEEAVEKLDEE